MKLIFALILTTCSINAFASPTASEGDSQIETLADDGRQILSISGDVARTLFETLRVKSEYIVREIKREGSTKTALQLMNESNLYGDWNCTVMAEKIKLKIQSVAPDAHCHLTVSKGGY